MSLLNRGASAIDKTFSATGKAKSLNPDAAEFVPFALRSPSGNTSAADTSSSFSNFGTATTGKSILDRSESSVSNNSEDEAHQFWRHQLPDDIIPDFNVVGEEESQGINSISFSKLSIADVNGTSRFLSSNQRELSPRQINGRSFAENMRYSLPAYGGSPSVANVQQMRAKPWDIHGDQMLSGIIDGPPYNGDSGQGYLNGMLNEQQMEATEVNSLEFLASQFPGFEAESLAEVYYANGGDLNMTIEMLTQLELQVDNGLNQNLNSKAMSAPNISALDFPALSPTDNKNSVPTFSPRDQQQSLNSYRSLEKELLMFKSSSTSPSLGATDFASAVRKLASQDSGIWKYDKSPSPNSTIGSSRSSHASGYGGGGNGRASYGDRLANRSSSRSAPVWLETGDAVANMYSEMRGEARDHARLRNAYFEQSQVLCLEGQALALLRWQEKQEPFGHWDMLNASVLDRFQPSQAGGLHEQFLAIQQTGTVREYVRQFEKMLVQLDGIPEPVMISTFMKGLKSDLRTAVILLQPHGLTQTIKLAIMVDEDRAAKSLSKDNSGVGSAKLSVGDAKTANASVGDPTQTKHLTDAELADKRAKGLCFRCDGKFGPRHRGHRCPEKNLRCLRVTLEPEEGEADEMEGPPKP